MRPTGPGPFREFNDFNCFKTVGLASSISKGGAMVALLLMSSGRSARGFSNLVKKVFRSSELNGFC